jgi:HNH endonuclease
VLTLERIHSLLLYDEESGLLYWKARGIPRWDSKWAGKVAGCIKRDKKCPCEYIILGIDGIKYRAHRIIWWMKTGQNPVENIDHENHNGLDNRWENLRIAPHKENQKNMSKRKDNTTGVTGVIRHRDKYVAQIQVDGNRIYLGSRCSLEEASGLRLQAEQKYEFHKNHGK